MLAFAGCSNDNEGQSMMGNWAVRGLSTVQARPGQGSYQGRGTNKRMGPTSSQSLSLEEQLAAIACSYPQRIVVRE
jgi:hypothetical protein